MSSERSVHETRTTTHIIEKETKKRECIERYHSEDSEWRKFGIRVTAESERFANTRVCCMRRKTKSRHVTKLFPSGAPTRGPTGRLGPIQIANDPFDSNDFYKILCLVLKVTHSMYAMDPLHFQPSNRYMTRNRPISDEHSSK